MITSIVMLLSWLIVQDFVFQESNSKAGEVCYVGAYDGFYIIGGDVEEKSITDHRSRNFFCPKEFLLGRFLQWKHE